MKYNDDIHLNPREIQLLGCLIKDDSYKMISEALHIKYKTVSNELAHLRQKTNRHSMHGLVGFAFTHGFSYNFEADEVFYFGEKIAC